MFFQGDILVDPSKETVIESIKPDSSVKKLFHYLTAGVFSEKVEKESFEAIQILHKLYTVLQSVEIDNIVRLQVDGEDAYFDSEGLQNDLSTAINKFKNIRNSDSGEFDDLKMILEHSDNFFNYFITIDYSSIHEPGKFPIRVRVFGLFKEFEATQTENAERLKLRLAHIFKSQESHQIYLKGKRNRFDSFMKSLRLNLKRNIDSDNIKSLETQLMLIGSGTVDKVGDIPMTPSTPLPIFHGYYNLDKKVFYSYQWTDLIVEKEFWVSNVIIMSDDGKELAKIEETPFYPSKSILFAKHDG
ncbi:hypothetical protein OO013_12625 [Mangrovivirga sp. M17]|uniref:Uncharacterized protein n=1 Tax=Mangrovivirga halotolerans TaxID=2993936 RepID=A0ABT3RSF8_9BACT|nr:hypothetical protein [Mangrovivirga halotolerans]MCX2744719.1 hypothetical protein [Mangrovivirga halotolerans]